LNSSWGGCPEPWVEKEKGGGVVESKRRGKRTGSWEEQGVSHGPHGSETIDDSLLA